MCKGDRVTVRTRRCTGQEQVLGREQYAAMSSLQSAAESQSEMDKSGVYIVSHKPLDTDGIKKRDDTPAYVNAGYDTTGDGDSSVKYKSQDGVHLEKHCSDAPYRGMGKEDLLRHSSKPLWRRMRYVCMSIILLGWLALIITVVALVLIYPRCRDPRKQEWWQKTVVYRIYVPSFQDTDGDGIGDLNGISERLNYLSQLGVETVSLSPIYHTRPTPENDFDIINHKAIQQQYGTLDDFRNLVNKTHDHGMKLILDFIPNLTSDQHPWFLSSRGNSSGRMRNYYVWEKGNGANPPNNWKSVYNGPAWMLDTTRNEYYLHQFRPRQPDLNLRSEEVKDELKSILQYWLNEGVDGFYIRDSGYLFEDYDLRNEMPADPAPPSAGPDDYDYYNHTYTYGLAEINDMLARWRYFLDDYGNTTNRYRMLFADIHGDIRQTMSYYGYFNRDGVDFPLNRFCLNLTKGEDGSVVSGVVNLWMNNLPAGRWPNWMGGDDNSKRLHDRLGGNMTRAFLMLSMLLPGTPFYYYGDEIGMVDSKTTPANPWDPNKKMRGLMRWDNTTNGGFTNSSSSPWIPPNDFTGENAVEVQNITGSSLMHLFTNLTILRSQASFQYGDFIRSVMDDSVVSFVREFDGEKGFLVAINFGSKIETRKYTGTHDTIPSSADVELTTGNQVGVSAGDSVDCSSLSLGPYQGVVVSWDYVAKEL